MLVIPRCGGATTAALLLAFVWYGDVRLSPVGLAVTARAVLFILALEHELCERDISPISPPPRLRRWLRRASTALCTLRARHAVTDIGVPIVKVVDRALRT